MKKLLLFIIINLSIFIIIFEFSRYSQNEKALKYSYKDILEKKGDILFVGTSRAIVFRDFNIDSIIGKRSQVLAKHGCSFTTLFILLKQLYSNKFKTKEAVLFVDFAQFYGEMLAVNCAPYQNEPISYGLILKMLFYESNIQYVKDYILKKIFLPKPRERLNKKSSFTKEAINGRRLMLYDYLKYKKKYYNKQMNEFKAIIKLLKSKNVKISIISLPHLIRDEPEQGTSRSDIQKICKMNAIEYYDYSIEMNDTCYFNDMDHFNKYGTYTFASKYLAKNQ